MEDYPQIKKIYEDIKNLNIQGATNVAISTFEAMKIYIELNREESKEKFLSTLFEIGKQLAYARDNEPLARNGVTYLKHFFGQQFSVLPEISVMKREFTTLCDKYLALIEETKQKILDNNSRNLLNYDKVLTHCHSSTAVSLIKAIGKGDNDFEVVCTETRPRFQGRKTALSLLEAKIKTTLITDSAAESFVIGRGSVPIDVVFIGCDQITSKGHAINKIGSWGISMAAYYAGKPVYVVTPLLKIDSNSFLESVKIEVRESREIWEDAPKDLHIFNPAFEIVDNVLITGYLTEFGLIHPTNVENIVKEQYPWILDN